MKVVFRRSSHRLAKKTRPLPIAACVLCRLCLCACAEQPRSFIPDFYEYSYDYDDDDDSVNLASSGFLSANDMWCLSDNTEEERILSALYQEQGSRSRGRRDSPPPEQQSQQRKQMRPKKALIDDRIPPPQKRPDKPAQTRKLTNPTRPAVSERTHNDGAVSKEEAAGIKTRDQEHQNKTSTASCSKATNQSVPTVALVDLPNELTYQRPSLLRQQQTPPKESEPEQAAPPDNDQDVTTTESPQQVVASENSADSFQDTTNNEQIRQIREAKPAPNPHPVPQQHHQQQQHQRLSTGATPISDPVVSARSSATAAAAGGGSSGRRAVPMAAAAAAAGPWVRKFLTRSTAKQEMLMLVPLDFWMDSFNLAQLAPIVENIVQSHKSYNMAQEQQTGRQEQQQQQPDVTEHENSSGNSQQQSKQNSPFPLYRRALQLITSQQPIRSKDMLGADAQDVEMAAVVLYCLVHQRYVLSPRGLEALRRRFLLGHGMTSNNNGSRDATSGGGGGSGVVILDDLEHRPVSPLFGRCPRPSCQGMPLLPAGHDDYRLPLLTLDDNESSSNNKNPRCSFRYCGQCQTYWVHWMNDVSSSSSKWVLGRYVQGCAWGLSLGPLFHLSFPGFLQPATDGTTTKGLLLPQEPRIFGFRMHPLAHNMHHHHLFNRR